MVLEKLQHSKAGKQKLTAVLIDPDDSESEILEVLEIALINQVEYFLVGGSLVSKGNTLHCVHLLKDNGARNVILFPGHEIQVVEGADAILFMSLISGRNAEFLIGKQVAAAPWVKKAGLETLPTGYMLVESGKLTSALYMSHTIPLPANKPDIAAATALAGQMLGMQLHYLDAGSGADGPVPETIITAVSKTVNSILFVGGGIRSAKQAYNAWQAGADVVVIGNGVFENSAIIEEICAMCKKCNTPGIGVQNL